MMIRSRLAVSLGAIAALLTLPLVVAVVSLIQLRDDVRSLRERDFAASVVLGRLRAAIEELRAASTPIASDADTAAWRLVAEDGRRITSMGALVAPFGLGAASDRLGESLRDVSRHADGAHAAARAADRQRVAGAAASLGLAMGRAVQSLNEAERTLHARTERRVERAGERTTSAVAMSAGSSLVALLLVIAIAVGITRLISRPIRDLTRGMEAVADGRLDHRLTTEPTRADEFGYLAGGFTAMVGRLAELEKLRASWLSQLTHELKTPLVVMQGTLEMFDAGINAQLTPKGKDFCGRSIRASKVLQRRIMNMIDVGRFLADQGSIEARPIQLSVFLGDLDASFQVIGAREGVHFRLTRQSALPEHVEWDEDRAREVFENLVSNAFKFTRKDGLVELEAAPGPGVVVFKVRDDGAGIPSEALPRLFDPYFQADNQRRANKKGTGLGLAIVKQIVDMHGGQVDVESEVDRGTTFTVTLPVRAGAAPRPPVQAPNGVGAPRVSLPGGVAARS